MLLVLWSPLPDSSLVGQEHGRTIPLADIDQPLIKSVPFDDRPVMVPPGRARLVTKSAPTGSAVTANTIGVAGSPSYFAVADKRDVSVKAAAALERDHAVRS